MTDDRRKYVRCSYYYDAEMRAGGEEWKKTNVEDLSAGGLKFTEKDEDIPFGGTLWFKLEAEVAGQTVVAPTATMKGRIVRSMSIGEGYFEYGVEFIDKDSEGLAAILRLLGE
jgi:c-di-GMP-binding flagellar brake protein YcgR